MNVLIKSIFREIKNSIERYLAIFSIIALGVGFFAGLCVYRPALVNTAEKYLEEQKFYDYRILSSIGFSKNNTAPFSDLQNISSAEGAHYEDVLIAIGKNDLTFRVHSITNNINKLNIISGRLPETDSECVLDASFFDENMIGQTISFSDSNKEEIFDAFHTSEFTVVGIATSPLYISADRGTTSLGDGNITAFLFVNESCFTSDYYKEIYMTLKDSGALYSDAYKNAVAEQEDEVTEEAKIQANIRYEEIVEEAQKEIDDAKIKLDEASANLQAQKELAIQEAAQQIPNVGFPSLEENPYYIEMVDQIEASFKEPENELAKKYLDIEEAQKEVDSIKRPSVYILKRSENTGYASFDQDSSIIENISVVFPVFFFLVAALVCGTTMTRMVDEQRTQIGVWKAMGYNKLQISRKYLFYSGSAGLFGGIIGFFCGTVFIPKIFWSAYKTIYNFSDSLLYVFDWKMCIISLGVAMLCTAVISALCCFKELYDVPALILRPKAPKNGKRILLERTRIWRRISFLHKVSLRNVVRYKQRFFLMILGISGCTALLLTGFGIQDSIQNVTDYQYEEIIQYDAKVTFTDSLMSEEQNQFIEQHQTMITDSIFLSENNIEITANGISKNTTITSAKEDITPFIHLKTSDTIISYPKDGEIIICKGIADKLNIKTGDVVTLTNDDFEQINVAVTGIFDNYINNYLFISENTMIQLYSDASVNAAYLNFNTDINTHNIIASMLNEDIVSHIMLNEDIKESIEESFSSLNLVVLLIIVCAGILAFIVLFNLININIGERIREIATIKVLGFFNSESSAYIFREINMLTSIGALLGLFFGKLLHSFAMSKIKPDAMCFDSRIAWKSYLFSFILTLVFAGLVKIAMRYKLKKISMAESLKSVE